MRDSALPPVFHQFPAPCTAGRNFVQLLTTMSIHNEYRIMIGLAIGTDIPRQYIRDGKCVCIWITVGHAHSPRIHKGRPSNALQDRLKFAYRYREQPQLVNHRTSEFGGLRALKQHPQGLQREVSQDLVMTIVVAYPHRLDSETEILVYTFLSQIGESHIGK
jgi:hypothetical protein